MLHVEQEGEEVKVIGRKARRHEEDVGKKGGGRVGGGMDQCCGPVHIYTLQLLLEYFGGCQTGC